MKRNEYLAMLGFLLSTILLGGVSLAEEEQSIEVDPNRYEQYIQNFEHWDQKNAFPADGVLFMGSSSIRMWMTRESFPTLPVINRGFGGAHISDVNHFADRIVFPYKPRVIVFYAGDNDVARGKKADRVLADYITFVNTVHERLPDTKIVYLPIKPSIARWKHWPEMHKANAMIQELIDKDPKQYYVDTTAPMLHNENQVRKDIFLEDGLHLNSTGYELWTRELEPILTKLMTH